MNLRYRDVGACLTATLLVSFLTGSTAAAQGAAPFVYVKNVKVTQLSNAVRVSIEADGTINLVQDNAFYQQFFINGDLKPVRTFHMRLSNCRSKVGSFKAVAVYPVDHLEFAVPQDASSGVGLDVTTVLDVAAIPAYLHLSTEPVAAVEVLITQPPDRRSISITVSSDARPEIKPIQKLLGDAGANENLSVKPHEGFVDISAANEPLSAVARSLSAASGLRISVEQGADRLVSAVLQHQKPEDALLTLCNAYDLALSVEGGTFLVRGDHLGEPQNPELSEIPLVYLTAERALSLLPTFLLHYVHSDPYRNGVVVSGAPAVRARVARDLSTLDRPILQCRVMATFVTYSQTSNFNQTLEVARRTSDSTVRVAAGIAGAPAGLVIYERASSTSPGIDLSLLALRQGTDLVVDTRPSIVLTNGQSGSIFDGQTYLLVFNGIYSGGLQQIQVGASLQAVATIGENGIITLRLQLGSSDVLTQSSAGALPTVESRTLTSTIRIKTGDTIYIGGLDQNQRLYQRYKIPLLGDTPVVGPLFREQNRQRQQVHVGVFVTATLL